MYIPGIEIWLYSCSIVRSCGIGRRGAHGSDGGRRGRRGGRICHLRRARRYSAWIQQPDCLYHQGSCGKPRLPDIQRAPLPATASRDGQHHTAAESTRFLMRRSHRPKADRGPPADGLARAAQPAAARQGHEAAREPAGAQQFRSAKNTSCHCHCHSHSHSHRDSHRDSCCCYIVELAASQAAAAVQGQAASTGRQQY